MSKITTTAFTGTRPRRMARPSPSETDKPQVADSERAGGGSADNPGTAADPQAPAGSTAQSPRGPSKQDAVLALLARDEGATLAEMMAATGWLAHSTRAVLTGLRKKGHAIIKSKRNEATCYRLAKVA